MNILEGLNEAQKEAVQHINGPLLVVAGAGSGKTKVITHRIAYLIHAGISPENILAVTFTNKAAREMKERIFKLLKLQLGNPASERESNFRASPFISTFHSLGVYILRQDGKKIGVPKNFSILDDGDSLKIIKEVLKELNLSQDSFQPSRFRAFISGQKNKLVDYEKFSEEASDYFPKIVAEVWYRYETKLKERACLDFDDLIAKTILLLKKDSEILAKYRNKWTFIHIDEYQDTNYSQYVLSRLLVGRDGNICVVGDADQAIYSFRGADFTNILKFEKDWDNPKVIILEKNYRSTQNILSAANAVISFNKIRLPKNLFSANNEKGNWPLLYAAENEIEEGEFVANMIKNSHLIADAGSTAILLRTNFQSRIFEEAFLNHAIPYEVVGVKFYERKEIKDVLAYIKYSLNRNDFLSFGRIVNSPPRGIGEKTLLKYFSAKGGKEGNISSDKRNALNRIEKLIARISQSLEILAPSSLIKQIFKRSGYEDYLAGLGEEGNRRIENIKELVSLAKKYDRFPPPSGIEKMLEDSALMSEQDLSIGATQESRERKQTSYGAGKKAVKIMTVHAAKGLEFDTVFAAGLEEGLFPYVSYNDLDKEAKLEEERRLFYVSITRAKKNLFLSYAKTRVIFGEKKINTPSRFLTEISENIRGVDN